MIKVLKFGGASLRNAKSVRQVAEIILATKEDKAVVISAIEGVTDQLIRFLNTLGPTNRKQEDAIKSFIASLKKQHLGILSKAIPTHHSVRAETHKTIQSGSSRQSRDSLQANIDKLERLFYGVSYLGEVSPRSRDLIISFGERFSVILLAEVLHTLGSRAQFIEADKVGLITDGDFGKASALLGPTTRNLRKALLPLITKGVTPIITGFFGCDQRGRTTIFGRGGSDYSASVVAYALDADGLEIWKDVDGFMSVSPEIVKTAPKLSPPNRAPAPPRRRRGESLAFGGGLRCDSAHIIDILSYDEAAELAYFGVEILHPRMVEPTMLKNIPIIIRNTFNPTHKGTSIVRQGYERKGVIKGIAYDKNISALKIHGAGVGYKPGVLREITDKIANLGINIKSVITSQTCITLLLNSNDLEEGYLAIRKAQIKVIEHLEKVSDVALIGVVGEGLIRTKGLAARVFRAVADANINVEMISAGASAVAYYFIVKNKYLKQAVRAIYQEFFPAG
ncbi:MAG: ACT domain-containing protein [Planctomycetota bacterium]|nr:ACT domain-containing protein [Planctomycetota bacterium]MDI6787165.1 ACT domain-containing protein [Planctomycetota bacterium]